MQKVKVKFKNSDALQMLIDAISNYSHSLAILIGCEDRNTSEYKTFLLKSSVAINLHNELQRYVFRSNASYPSSKSYSLHKAVIINEALQHMTLSSNNYYNSMCQLMLMDVNQQIVI